MHSGFTVVFNQCCWTAPYRKPTRLLTNLKPLRLWGPYTWPTFDAQGRYQGPATDICKCAPTVSLARSADDDSFRTTATSIYPEPIDRAIAQAILDTFAIPPSRAKEGGKRKSGEDGKKRALEPNLDRQQALSNKALNSGVRSLSNAGTTTLSNAGATTLSNAGDKSTVETELNGGATLSGALCSRPGLGPPM